MTKVAVYTAVAGQYDALISPPSILGVDFHAWSDRPDYGDGWIMHEMDDNADWHPRMRAKQYKLQPHLWLPEYDYTIWIDASHRIVRPEFVDEAIGELGDAAIAMYKHPWRDCIYDEAMASVALRKYDGQAILPQVAAYRAEGHPPHWGLWACGTIVRDNSAVARLVDEAWWGEIMHWTYQDQLSLPVVCRRLGVLPATFTHHQLIPRWTVIEGHASDL